MNFTLTRPCNDCPFLKEGGVQLTRTHVIEIAGAMLDSQGATFQCHKTVTWNNDDDQYDVPVQTTKDQHCAGALIFAEKHHNATQMMRICERLGLYDAATLMRDQAVVARVFDSLGEMLTTALY